MARAAAPVHEAVVTPVAPGADNRSYTICVKPRHAAVHQCQWTLRVEEDAPGALTSRPFGAFASDDGLRVAVILRKRRGERRVDELWRFHQQMNPDFAVPGTPSDETLVTRGKLIATGFPLEFGANLALNRFAVSDGRSIQAIDDRGNILATLYQAPTGAPNLALVERSASLAGFVEPGDSGALTRLVIADLEAPGADVYSARSLHGGVEAAWNLERGWVAITDFPERSEVSTPEATTRTASTTLRVVDLANQRVLFETRRPAIAMQPAWLDADTLAWRLDETHTQTQKFDARSDIRLMQGIVRLQGERLMFLPCRERSVLLVDESASSADLMDVLRRSLAHDDKLFVEAFGTRVGSGIALDALAQAGRDPNGCTLKPDRAIMQARGTASNWQFNVTTQAIRLEETGRPPVVLPYVRPRWLEGRRSIAARSDSVRIDLQAMPEPCHDAQVNTVYGQRVTLRITDKAKNTRELRGCGMFLYQGSDDARALAAR